MRVQVVAIVMRVRMLVRHRLVVMPVGMGLHEVQRDAGHPARDRLVERIQAVKPHVVLGHSLGSLVCYDTFTHEESRATASGRYFVSLGSQIGNPFVRGEYQAGRLSAIAEEVTRVEGRSDELHDQGLKDLFKQFGKSDPMAYIIGSEIYGELEKVVDRFEDVANEISGIVIENV